MIIECKPRILRPQAQQVQIDRSSPLAAGLSFCAPCTEGGGFPVELVTRTQPVLGAGSLKWITGTRGPGYGPGSSIDLRYNMDPIGGLATYTVFSAFHFPSTMPTGNEALGLTKWDGNGTVLLLRRQAANGTRVLAAFSGGNIDVNTAADGFTSGYNSLCVVLASAAMTVYCNGLSVATASGSGTQNTTAYYTIFGDEIGANSANGLSSSVNAIGYCAYAWKRALTPGEVWLMHRAPYTFIEPIARKHIVGIAVAAGGATQRGRSLIIGQAVNRSRYW